MLPVSCLLLEAANSVGEALRRTHPWIVGVFGVCLTEEARIWATGL